MEENLSFQNIEEENNQEKLNGLKIIADQMAKRFFGLDENLINNLKLSKEEYYKLILDKNISNDNNKKTDETEKRKNKNDNAKIIDDQIKVNNQIQEINSNINTNINTKENQNTLINTNINTGTNINTNPNNNINYDNDNISNRDNNKNQNQSTFIEESINDDNKNEKEQNDDEQEIDKSESNNDIEISIEKISNKLIDDLNDSFNENTLVNTALYKPKKSNLGKKTIYERGIRALQKRENKLQKKRKEKLDNTMKEISHFPIIDPYSEELIENKYIPIQQRASAIHSLKLFNNIMNEENKKIKDYQKDMIEIKKCKLKNKKFEKKDWNKFIKRQKKWNKEIQYKIKAAILIRDNDENEYFFKPKINEKSKSIIKSLEDESTNYIDDVYSRLYNDFEEHKERQKFRNQQSLPSFKPKVIKCNSQKNIDFNQEKIKFNKCSSNFSLYLEKKNKNKHSNIMNNSVDNNWHELFIDSCTNFQKKYKNNVDKYEKYINKISKTNQQSKNNISKNNSSNNNSRLINNKNNNNKPKNNSSVPFLPFNIKKMIENNCREENENNYNINELNSNISEKKYFNHSLYNIEDSKEKEKEKQQKNNEKYNESKLESLYVGTERNNSENSNEFNNNNNSNSKLSENKKGSNNKFIGSKESEKIENNIYKINTKINK